MYPAWFLTYLQSFCVTIQILCIKLWIFVHVSCMNPHMFTRFLRNRSNSMPKLMTLRACILHESTQIYKVSASTFKFYDKFDEFPCMSPAWILTYLRGFCVIIQVRWQKYEFACMFPAWILTYLRGFCVIIQIRSTT